MKKFFVKAVLISLPFICILLLYIITDPYKVIYKYNALLPSEVALNKDYVSFTTFKQNYPIYTYDSFIFGNSRAIFYRVETWQKLINSNKTFHFDAASESLMGVYSKINYLHSKNVSIKNALLVVDHSLLYKTDFGSGRLFMPYYEVNDKNYVIYQWNFFTEFLNPDFILAYTHFLLSDSIHPYMKKYLNKAKAVYNPRYNQGEYKKIEEQIANNPQDYYSQNLLQEFKSKPQKQKNSHVILKKSQIDLLQKIHKIFTEQHTNVKIVISPLYDKKKLNSADLEVLQNIFGKQNVFDFSGENSITTNYMNYYESSHYRPHVSDSIMQLIYSNK